MLKRWSNGRGKEGMCEKEEEGEDAQEWDERLVVSSSALGLLGLT